MESNIYVLKSERIEICEGQYSIRQHMSGQIPICSDKRNFISKEKLFEEHRKQLSHSGLTSMTTTVQWTNFN
ncbi:MAG: hypothetical protein WCX73_00295 [Candidatus Pacearchaeota archaeon]|jgi:hypothetical protein